jgi:hypothetical protein
MDNNQTSATEQAINPLTAAFNLHVKTSYYLDDGDFYAGTRAVYGKRIELLETPNDTTHEYNDVDGGIADHEEDDLKTAIEDGDIQCWNAGLILNDLVRRGVLPTGDYFIRVSW